MVGVGRETSRDCTCKTLPVELRRGATAHTMMPGQSSMRLELGWIWDSELWIVQGSWSAASGTIDRKPIDHGQRRTGGQRKKSRMAPEQLCSEKRGSRGMTRRMVPQGVSPSAGLRTQAPRLLGCDLRMYAYVVDPDPK